MDEDVALRRVDDDLVRLFKRRKHWIDCGLCFLLFPVESRFRIDDRAS